MTRSGCGERATGALAAADQLAAVAGDHAAEGEELRRLPPATVEALRGSDLSRMCAPAVYGGGEVDPMTLVEAIERVGRADAAAGWCLMVSSTSSSMASFLAPETAQELYGRPGGVTCGVFAPMATGVADGGGFRVTGRWPWGSGTQHADHVLGGTNCDDGTFRLCWFDVDDVTFHDTWYTSGLRGTGSLEFSVDGVLVPAERTVQPGVARPQVESPLAAFPNFGLLAAGVAAVALGIGRRAVDELLALAEDKRPQYSAKTLAESSFTQVELARAEGTLRAGRAFLLAELAAAWEEAQGAVPADRRLDLSTRARIRPAAGHAVLAATAATDACYTLAGGTSIFSSHPLQRCLRDVHVATQHLMVAPKLYETVGKVLLGQPANTTQV